MRRSRTRLTGLAVLAALLLLAAVLVGSTAGAQAPSAGDAAPDAPDATYTLNWWTVDGGGASYVTSGGYALGGTAGQPDAARPRSKSTGVYTFTLQSGFWRPACAPSEVHPAIARENISYVVVSWTNEAPNQYYWVYRGETPYFTEQQASASLQVLAAPWEYHESVPVVGDPSKNFFYFVRAFCGPSYVDSARVGEFDFGLVRGG